MDRTMMAPWRAEEKEHSEKLYKKLKGLSLLYPMNDEMQKLLSVDIFLKPNQPAFFQVMHYLFRILDPAEFKRRFFWPLTDKKSEATFRTSTVDYLKHLNAKHNLNWTNIKSYLVVMPGGMKFINFLLDLVSFVVQELTRQREKALSADTDILKYRNWSVQRMSAANVFRKEYTSAYIEELEENASQYRDFTQKIRQIFSAIAAETDVNEALLLDDAFLEDFDASNRRKCEQKITLPAAKIAMLEAPLCALKDVMDQFQGKRAHYKQNKEAAENALRGIQKLFGTDVDYATGNGALLSAFNSISETIAEQLDANDHYNECNEFVTTDLENLRAELQQIDLQVSAVQRNLNARAKEHGSNISGNASQMCSQLAVPSTPLRTLDARTEAGAAGHPLLMKFVSTPPIRPELASGVRNVHLRLPLQDDFNAKQFETTCNSLLVPAAPRSARKIKLEPSSELNSTMNRSRIVDPMQLLRTINKKSDKSNTMGNLSSLGSKWKQIQATFDFDDATLAMPTSPKNTASSSYLPFTPHNCNERTRIERVQHPQAADTSNSSLYAKKSAAMMKVLDASLNVQNLSTSPSGRLDALVPGPLSEQDLPRLHLNDQTLEFQQLQCSSKENDANHMNQPPPKFSLDISDHGEKDDLQNISDSVLKNISF
ncbi:augmin complex subunit dgt6 isoform X2 [Drosophila virilis]|uniref:augmin complex subunit dgt6 isoform X2 n=1 Tax=Drosophila virilis TaxID=7244 RepID=UPI001395E5DE|nr:augmin complex subunit dgt6 isoform X2 [Drosophila virilis]